VATYALITDIHGNVDAMMAVAESIRAAGDVDEIICLGDIIGYCPAVNETIDLLEELSGEYPIRYNLGSHDSAALGHYRFVDLTNDDDSKLLKEAGLETEEQIIEEYFDAEKRRFVPVRPEARDAMQWTLEHLSEAALAFLKEKLVLRIKLEPGVISVHGSPRDPACEYVRDQRFAQRCFESPEMNDVWLCFVGHTHLPVIWRMSRAEIVEMAGSKVCLSPPKPDFAEGVELRRSTCNYIINVGSVGQPRDRDPRATYGRFDSSTHRFEHVRVMYDLDAAAQRIRDAGLAERLAERLYQGQ
jgi:diadenosine tetraphosphatase ApaH/serine/threonine PP2A family protein phosphatase